jgi:hypothetical protein
MLQMQDLLTIEVFEYGARGLQRLCERLRRHRQPQAGSNGEGVRDRGYGVQDLVERFLVTALCGGRSRRWRLASGLDRIDAAACTTNLREMSCAPGESAGDRLLMGAVGSSVQAT